MSILRDNINKGPAQLKNLISEKYVIAPGVFNGISAIIAEKVGFSALYLSGSGIAGAMGLPDLALTTLTEVADEVKKIVAVTRLPVIVDIDTGFGEVLNVMRAVRVIEAAGAAAIHIEDQELPKKCGHLAGKKIVSENTMIQKIKAAVEARKDENFMIIGRTDARSVYGFDEALRRGGLYIDAGADAIFPEALESEKEFELYAKKLPVPLLANMTEFGKSPLLSAHKLGKLGYKIIIFPLTAFRGALLTMQKIYNELYKAETQRNILNTLMTRTAFYELIGYNDYELEDQALYKNLITR